MGTSQQLGSVNQVWKERSFERIIGRSSALEAVLEDRAPAVDGEAGRQVVELFTAVYRSQKDHAVLRLPLSK